MDRFAIQHRLISWFLFFTVLRPLPGGEGGIELAAKRLIDVAWLALALFILLMYGLKDGKIKTSARRGVWWLLSMALLATISTFTAATFLQRNVVTGDLLEIYRWIYYALVLVITAGVPWSVEAIKRNILIPLLAALSISYVITIAAGLSAQAQALLSNIYTFKYEGVGILSRIQSASGFYYRTSGTFGNPNFFGVAVAVFLPFIYAASSSLSDKRARVAASFLAIVSFPIVALTGSRTGILAAVIATLLYSFGLRKFKGSRELPGKKYIYSIIVVIIAFSLAIAPMLVRIAVTLNEISEGGILEVHSLAVKYEESARYVSIALSESPFIGIGPSKNLNRYLGDNQYTKQFVRYGFVGLLVVVGFFLSVYTKACKIRKETRSITRFCYSNAVVAAVPVFLISCITGDFFEVTQLATILIVLFGVLYSLYYGS
jgi:hypothetical protein